MTKINPFKLFLILLFIFNIIFPIIFIWNVEISMEFIDDVYLTNGFWETSTLKNYHILAWVMVTTSILTSLYFFYNIERAIKE